MNDEAPRAPLTQAEQAEAERLLKAILADRPHLSVPTLWEAISHRGASDVYQDILTLIFRAHADGWDEGYFDGRADAREEAGEPGYNEGYE